MYEFGEFLFQLRKQNGLTQSELADKLDLTDKTISKWESGASYPTIEKLLILSNLFNITIDELIKGKLNNQSNLICDLKISKSRIKPITTKNLFFLLILLVSVIVGFAVYFILSYLKKIDYLSLGKGIPIVVTTIIITTSLSIYAYQILSSIFLKDKQRFMVIKSKKSILLVVFSTWLILQIPIMNILLKNNRIAFIIVLTTILSIGVSLGLIGINNLIKYTNDDWNSKN